MDRFAQAVERYRRRATDVERFVQLIVLGGIALVAGLWVSTLSATWSVPWLVGSALVLLGLGGLALGIWSEVET
ncbi:hypothetical protein [Haloarchaeobius amylolyticus]|uniref:hypothetical protein n=1 Tax=Haloarchaeobius amylolyticus TaxID=1198296 RepID=UPI0022703446|nr:hypothetical protein [Haloarchaeobius amylolyticus]